MENAELLQLIGIKKPSLCQLSNGVFLHEKIVADWRQLESNAQQFGLQLQAVSGYRSFERQLFIWNGKANGERAVLDADSRPIDISKLNDEQKLEKILIWSAIPGCSRHHWGTDLDVAAELPPDYQLQLVPAEYAAGGVLAELGAWLDRGALAECGFARPFQAGRSKVASEPWHISHVQQAAAFEQLLDAEALLDVLVQQPIALKDAIVKRWPQIFQDYVAAPCLQGQLCP